MSNQELEDQIDQKELAPGVLLIKEYKKVENDPNIPDIVGIFTFKVQLKTMNVVDFEVYLNQSENIELEDKEEGDELKTKNTIMPFETKVVAKVILKDNWKLKSKFKLTMGIPEKSAQIKYIEKDEKKIKNMIDTTESKLKNIPFEFMTIDEINSELKKLNTKFIDINFLPCDNSVINSKYDENLKNFLEYVIHWRRPEEFIQNELNENNDFDMDLRVFNRDKEPDPNDIRQGLIPCSHLDSALSSLAEKYNLIKRLFKNDIYNENGIYQIKLCVSGEWTTVVIDDYFPCIPMSSPLVTTSQSNELWILILEKALAKVYDCYYNLTCMNLSDFFLTLTGCPSFSYNLENLQSEEKKDIFNKIKNFVLEKKYLVVAISKMNDLDSNNNNEENEDDTSLTVPNYGYTIIDIKMKYKPNLIVLRRVWFDEKRENNIDNYINNLINEYPALVNEFNDNVLVLTFKDFLKEFSSLAVCLTKNWEEVHIRGKFVKIGDEIANSEENEQVMSKWYYSINLEKQTNLIISLFQDEDKFKENDARKNLLDISISVLKLELNNNTNKNEIIHIQTYDFSMSPNLQLEFNLPPGQYLIVPRTSGCLFGRSLLNNLKIEDKKNDNETEIYNMETKIFSSIFVNTVKDIFKKFDILLNKSLGFREFKQFLECVKSDVSNFDENVFKTMTEEFQSYNGNITENGFIEFWKKKAIENIEEIKNWLKALGYDNDLYPLKSRCFMLTFHSDIPISVSARDALSTDLNKKIDKLVIKSMGEKIKNKKDISVFQYQSKISNIYSYGCLNEGNEPFRVTINFKSENNIYSYGKNKIEKIVQPNKYEFFTHVFPFPNNDMNNELDFNIEYFPLN